MVIIIINIIIFMKPRNGSYNGPFDMGQFPGGGFDPSIS